MRTALILLFTLAGGAVFGSVFPQRPISPPRVEQYFADHPAAAPWLDRFGMFDVFGSAWFTAIYLALLTALVACLVPRARALARVLRSRPPKGAARLDRHRNTAVLDLAGTPDEVTERVAGVLSARRFRLARHGPGELAAEKGYLRELGSMVFHVSFLLLLVGLAVGKGDGFRGQLALTEGQDLVMTRSNFDVFEPGRFYSAGDLPPFSLTLNDFSNSFWPNGVPRSYRSEITAVDADGKVQHQAIAVNRPMTVDGIRLFQSDYGYAPWVKVTGPDGSVLADDPVQLLRSPETEISTGALKLPSLRPQLGLELTFFTDLGTPATAGGGFGLTNKPELRNPVLVVWPFQGDLRAGLASSVYTLDVTRMERVGDRPIVLRPGQTAQLPGGGTISMPVVRQFTILTATRDPGVPVVLVAAILILAGLIPSMYVTRRRVWARAEPAPGGGTRLRLAGLALQGKPAFAAEFEDLVQRVRDAAGPQRSPEADGEATLAPDTGSHEEAQKPAGTVPGRNRTGD
jgi:cytochrome c biogenesis protein